jgi:hypothetical protein
VKGRSEKYEFWVFLERQKKTGKIDRCELRLGWEEVD